MGQPTCFVIDGKITKKPSELANALQNFFKNKIRKLMLGVRKSGQDPLEFLTAAFKIWDEVNSLPVFNLKGISIDETRKLISKLGNTSAYGRDEIDAISLKSTANLLAPQIMHLINSSIASGNYIMKWKLARVIPVRKSREVSHMDPALYRPISLLPVLSKLVERVVQVQIQGHFERHGLIHPNSHAYQTNKSTTIAIMQIVEEMYEATDSNFMTSLMILDQSAAFDCVHHNLLIRKLRTYGCSEETLTWMNSYLTDRSQFIDIEGDRSRITSMTRGVPQGSILGPFLYLIYINEMAEVIKDRNCNQ